MDMIEIIIIEFLGKSILLIRLISLILQYGIFDSYNE